MGDRLTEIKAVYNAEGTDALEPLDVHWLIQEVVRLRYVEAFQDQLLEAFWESADG